MKLIKKFLIILTASLTVSSIAFGYYSFDAAVRPGSSVTQSTRQKVNSDGYTCARVINGLDNGVGIYYIANGRASGTIYNNYDEANIYTGTSGSVTLTVSGASNSGVGYVSGQWIP